MKDVSPSQPDRVDSHRSPINPDASPMLTPRQIQILRWFDENPSTRSRWLVNGRNPKGGEGYEKWTHMEVSGSSGSILIAAEDIKATRSYKSTCPSPDKMWGLNEKGRAALKASEVSDDR